MFIADGYDLPPQRLGCEEFVRCRKGMWHQRVFGWQYAEKHSGSDYILALDDDVSFEPYYAEKCLEIIGQTGAGVFTSAIFSANQKERVIVSPWAFKSLLNRFLGTRFEKRGSKFRIGVAPTGGFIANTDLPCPTNPTQSCQFAAVWTKNGIVSRLRLQDEYWLEGAKYCLPDDQVFGYKAYINHVPSFNSRSVFYRHLDAGSSNSSRIYDGSYASGRNFLIFWHRFLWKQATTPWRKLRLIHGITYRLVNNCMFSIATSLLKRNPQGLKGYLKGVSDGWRYLRSEEYAHLPGAVTNQDNAE